LGLLLTDKFHVSEISFIRIEGKFLKIDSSDYSVSVCNICCLVNLVVGSNRQTRSMSVVVHQEGLKICS
jgi:hypothetical protein